MDHQERGVAPGEWPLRATDVDTVENYALAVGAQVEIRVRPGW